MRSSIRYVGCICLLLVVPLLSAGVLLTYASTTVSILPSSVSAFVGQDFGVDVAISGVSSLYGWEFRISWDTNLLDATRVVEGPFLKTGGNTFFTYGVNSTVGDMVVDSTLIGRASGANGTGVLSTVTFHVKNPGQTSLNLYNVTLIDSANQDIICTTVSASGLFVIPQDLAIARIDFSPTILLPGNVVNINVTVQNLGTLSEIFNTTAYVNAQQIGFNINSSLDAGKLTVIPFTWSTEGLSKGDYWISAFVSVVPDEVNTANNHLENATPATLLFNGHDVAVTSVKGAKTIVGRGYSALISAQVKNFGIFTETFDSTLYVNGTAQYVQTVTLSSGISTAVSFTWNTTNLLYGNYTPSAYASLVLGENDTSNNLLVSSAAIHVGVPGDVSSVTTGACDGTVNMRDINYLILRFNTYPSSTNWNPNADVNGDGTVNMRDINICILHFNQHE